MIFNEDANLDEVGKKIILSSSFTGSTRYLQQLYQDSMAIVREFGKPDLFITVTCNPKWPEITSELLPKQKSANRPDLETRVFKLKLDAIINDLVVNGVLGKVIAYTYVVEFQKRGLPHTHILLILASEDKPQTPEDYDRIISAEIPDPVTQPKLYNIISQCMVHGPCGKINAKSPCMINGKCSKYFPRDLTAETTTNKTGYPVYRRRENSRRIHKKRIKFLIDNRWIVPYNPYLSQKYNYHLNVEICSSVRSVKYLYKYVYKGQNRVLISVVKNHHNPNKEIRNYLDARYVSASEGIWRLFNFGLHKRSHTVERLPAHLPEKQSVTFQPSQSISSALEKEKYTKLTRYFELCANTPNDEFFENLRYCDVPKHFTWNKSTNNWQRRKQRGAKIISRMYFVNPKDTERFYLRALLNIGRGVTSFLDLRTLDTTEYSSYFETAFHAGLVDNDRECFNCLEEAKNFKMPAQLRHLFAFILVYCRPVNVKELWDKYIEHLIEDFQLTSNNRELNITKVLIIIEKYLIQNRLALSDITGLPTPNYALLEDENYQNTIAAEELNFDQDELNETLNNNRDRLNPEQKIIYDTIVAALNGNFDKHLFFIDGPGGTGKTFLYNLILAYIRSKEYGLNGIAIAVASSGIAALLMSGGRTAHSRFKIPLNLAEDSTCNIELQSDIAQLIRDAKAILWDEAPMLHRHAFEAVNKLFKFITGEKEKPFGGKIMIFGGDFRQILPVVIRGSRGQVVNACIKSSKFWEDVHSIKLTTNMRVLNQNDPEQEKFAKFLLEVGEGRVPVDSNFPENIIKLPDYMALDSENLDDLISEVFDDINTNYQDPDYIQKRAILTTKNSDVELINNHILDQLPDPKEYEYLSADSVEDQDQVDASLYSIEFLNTLTPSGMPPFCLTLKENVPIILLRNLNASEGLCNSTRLIVKGCYKYLIDAEILTDINKGKRVLIPRVRLTPSDTDLPFQLVRRQFPIKLSFAMTINKAQGQTILNMGLYLPKPVFTHGQLYVALSRVQSNDKIKVMVINGHIEGKEDIYTKNIVYREIFDHEDVSLEAETEEVVESREAEEDWDSEDLYDT